MCQKDFRIYTTVASVSVTVTLQRVYKCIEFGGGIFENLL